MLPMISFMQEIEEGVSHGQRFFSKLGNASSTQPHAVSKSKEAKGSGDGSWAVGSQDRYMLAGKKISHPISICRYLCLQLFLSRFNEVRLVAESHIQDLSIIQLQSEAL